MDKNEKKFLITDVMNARYNEYGTITADIRFDNSTDGDGSPLYQSYTASAGDTTDYGRQLYADLVAGKYGPVTPFTATPEMIRAAKDRKRAEINAWRDEQENGSYLFQYNGHLWDYGKATQDRMSISLAMAKKG
ncbi:hypothetical protein NWX27_004910, partial [Salmonella enterica]|nr:hypothetical protein [Salmonella enterica]